MVKSGRTMLSDDQDSPDFMNLAAHLCQDCSMELMGLRSVVDFTSVVTVYKLCMTNLRLPTCVIDNDYVAGAF